MLAEQIPIPSQKIKYGLSRTVKFLKECKSPQKNFFSIQILGTNGKGTTVKLISQILISSGYRVGTFLSPHLVEVNERIQVNNQNISDKDIKYFLKKYYKRPLKTEPSFFELMTAMGAWYFNKQKVDFAILETGLGGRLDSVTACQNRILGFTPISMDHHNILGNTLKKIVLEKAGAIINSSQVCLSVNQGAYVNGLLSQEAGLLNNKIKIIRNSNSFKFKYLYGDQNQTNARLAQAIIFELEKIKKIKINKNIIKKGIFTTRWPGRFQIIKNNPLIIYDVAHNKDSLKCFLDSFIQFNRKKNIATKHIVLAFEESKKIRSTLKLFESHFHNIICSETNIRTSMKHNRIQSIFTKKTTGTANLENAIIQTIKKTNKNDCVVILGSHYIATTLNKIFKNCFVHK